MKNAAKKGFMAQHHENKGSNWFDGKIWKGGIRKPATFFVWGVGGKWFETDRTQYGPMDDTYAPENCSFRVENGRSHLSVK